PHPRLGIVHASGAAQQSKRPLRIKVPAERIRSPPIDTAERSLTVETTEATGRAEHHELTGQRTRRGESPITFEAEHRHPRSPADTAYGTGDQASDVRLTASVDHLGELDGRDSFDRYVNRLFRCQTDISVLGRGERRTARYDRRQGACATSFLSHR